jgi:lipoyl(octanoyl) transferase
MIVKDLNLIGFEEAYAIQNALARDVLANSRDETLLLLEHLPVYTIGRSGSEDNVLDRSLEAVHIDRGGDATFHGPGQLIGYPIVNLSGRGRDLHRYMRFLEEVLILTAADFKVDAYRIPGRTGVWTKRGKLASIGVGIRKWVTMHGFALNVCTSVLAGFERINPCGMKGCPITSLESEGAGTVLMQEVKALLMERFSQLIDQRLPSL